MTDLADRRYVHPHTAQDVLQTTFQAATPENADMVLDSFHRYGFDLIRTDLLDPAQRARVEALRVARDLAVTTTGDLLRAARFILTGEDSPAPAQGAAAVLCDLAGGAS